MLLNPLLKTRNTFFAPHLSADVAQSNAVSPAPKTMTVPYKLGNVVLHKHIPNLLAFATLGRKLFEV